MDPLHNLGLVAALEIILLSSKQWYFQKQSFQASIVSNKLWEMYFLRSKF